MLVLSRQQGERILIGQDVVVTVVQVRGNKVRLGIEAPKDVQVLRDDLDPARQGKITENIAQRNAELDQAETDG